MHRCIAVAALLLITIVGCGGGVTSSEAEAKDEPFAPAASPTTSADANMTIDVAIEVDPPVVVDPDAPVDAAIVVVDSVVVIDTAVVDAAATDTGEEEEEEILPPPPPPPPAGTCEDPKSLMQIVSCATDLMPRSGYTAPSAAMMTAWRGVVRAMMSGGCEAIAIAPELAGARVKLFRDSENGRTYCVLRGDGLGTFIVDPLAERELVHSAPHPLTDETTEQQALRLFRETRSRGYLLSGVPRRASSIVSDCQSGSMVSDAAHEDTHLFLAATAELASFYGTRDFTIFQWHGMSATTCPGVNAYMTYGVAGAPAAGSKLLQLRDAMRVAHPTWGLHTPGSASCSMGGTTNVEGRLINGVAATKVCGTGTSTASQRFIHIEQQPGYRDANDWIASVAKVFPAK